MLRFSHTAVGIQQGSELMFTAFEDGGQMWTGSGPRAEQRRVAFPAPFRGIPVVHLTLGMWDIAGGTNQRVDVTAEAIGLDGFTIVFRTWSDTRVARVRVDWMAIGPAHHVDDFEFD